MKKYIISSVVSCLLLGSVSFANAQVSCPVDYNCFSKSIIACPIGWTCVKNSDGSQIQTDKNYSATVSLVSNVSQAAPQPVIQGVGMVPQNEAAKLTAQIQSAQHFHALEYYLSVETYSAQCVDGYCPVGATPQIRADKLYKYESCRISNLESQLGNLYAGIATSTAPQQDCKNIY